MDQLLLDLHACLDKARLLIKEYEGKLRSINEREANTKQKEKSLSILHEGIAAREFECQKVENVVKLYKEATQLHAAANLRIQEADKAEKSFSSRVQEENSKLDEKRKVQAKEAENNLKRSKSIDDEVKRRVSKIVEDNNLNSKKVTEDAAAA